MKVGYVLKKFPRYSETFILREVLALEAMGVPLQILSLNLPRDGRFHGSLAQLRHAVEYLADARGSRGLAGLAADLPGEARSRDRVASCFWEAVDLGEPERFKYLAAAVRVASRARELGLTHLHAHFATSASEVARLASRISGVPYSFTAHAKDIFAAGVDAEDLRRKFRDAAFAVTVCDVNRRFLEERYPECRGKLVRLYNGIDLERWTPAAAPAGGAPVAGSREAGPPLVLAVGRFVEKKGFDVLLRAFALLRDGGTAFRGRILGDGELLESMRALNAELGLGGLVELPGSASSEQILAAMGEAALLACPCVVAVDGDRDALPTVLLEAMAAGLPCVASRVGGIPEILDDGRAGRLADAEPSALAAAMTEVLGDAELRSHLSARGRERAATLFDSRRNARVLAGHFGFAGAAGPLAECVPAGEAAS